MNFPTESRACYSNVCYHIDELDSFEESQARQASPFVKELVTQQWLTDSEVAVTKVDEIVPKSVVKQKADKLLRLTKSRAIQRLKSVA